MNGTALIWDLDGTLLDSYGVIASSLQETLAEARIRMELEEVRREAKSGSVSAVLQRAAAECGQPFRKLKERYSAVSGARIFEIPVMPHGVEVLEETAALGAVHFVYTHRGKTAGPVLEHLGLRRYFREVVTSVDGFPRKPSPDALLYLMGKYQLVKEQTLYVGDRSLDMDCAKNAGIRGVLYAPSGTGTADFVVRDLLDIPAILAK